MIKFSKIFLIIFISVLMFGCQTMKKDKKINSDENESLIDTQKVVADGQKSMDRKVQEGPKPKVLKKIPEVKRKTLTEEKVQNYVSIPDSYTNLKQNISINFQGLDFKYAMDLMAQIGDINILVGEEVSGTVTAKIDNVP